MSPRAAGGGGVLVLIGIVIVGRMLGCDPGQIQQAVNVAQQAQQQRGVIQETPARGGIDDEAGAHRPELRPLWGAVAVGAETGRLLAEEAPEEATEGEDE